MIFNVSFSFNFKNSTFLPEDVYLWFNLRKNLTWSLNLKLNIYSGLWYKVGS